MRVPILSPVLCLFLCTSAVMAPHATAALEEWRDAQGNEFKAEPAESLGPLALFRAKGGRGRMLAWRQLSPADCLRFYRQISSQPARAEDGAKGVGVVSREIAGKVLRVQDKQLVPAEFAGRPEPEFYVLFFANNSVGKSWDMLGHSAEYYWKLQQAHPGMVDGVFFGLRHSALDHKNMALTLNLPWLVSDYHEQRSMDTISRLGPVGDDQAYGLVIVNRDGVPVFAANAPVDADLAKVFGDLTGLLDLMRPGNPRSWADRAHYLRAVQPELHAKDRADPVLVGNPLMAEGLRQRGISRVEATIAVAADGKVTAVTIDPAGVPPNMIAPLADALNKACVFVPAVDQGQCVAGKYHYLLEVGR
jgi:hypothetical protein